jgi:hypothetical protein
MVVQADQTNITNIKNKLWANVTSTDDYIAAKRACDAATEAYNAACKTVIDQLAKKPDYQAAIAKKNKAAAALDNFQDTDDSGPDARANLAEAKMDASAAVTKMEGDAEAADDNCVKTKAALVSAQQTLDKFKTDFDASLPQNAEYAAAESKLQQDQQQQKSSSAAASSAKTGTSGSKTSTGG